MTAVQIFLLLNAVLIGVVLTIAAQHAYAHFKPKPQIAKPKPVNHLPPEIRERLVKQAEENFQGIVNRSALQLQNDLGSTTSQLNKLLEKFGSDILDDEMKMFKGDVEDIRKQTAATLGASQADVAKQQAEVVESLAARHADIERKLAQRQSMLEAEVENEMKVRKEQLAKELDTKLNDAVTAFLLETLGHDVDLGSQADYLVSVLEANKQQLIKGVSDEA